MRLKNALLVSARQEHPARLRVGHLTRPEDKQGHVADLPRLGMAQPCVLQFKWQTATLLPCFACDASVFLLVFCPGGVHRKGPHHGSGAHQSRARSPRF